MSEGETRGGASPAGENSPDRSPGKPLVSVLMITYNHEPYIEKSIQSILDQKTTFPFELVIGEDCSPDRTGEIARSYAEKYPDTIKLVTSSNNVGADANAKRVREAASGEYYAWCEGDDWWQAPHKLQAQIDVMLQDSDVGLVYSDHDRYSTSTGKTTHQYLKLRGIPATPTPSVAEILSGRAGILTCTVLARADLVNQIVSSDPYLYSGAFQMGDTQLWAEIALVSKVRFIDESMSVRNLLMESATRSRDERKVIEFSISNAEMCLYLCDKYSLPEDLVRFHKDSLRRYRLKLAFLEGDAEKTKSLLEEGERSFKDLLLHLGAEFRLVRWPLLLFRRLRRFRQPMH